MDAPLTAAMVHDYLGGKPYHEMWLTANQVAMLALHFNLDMVKGPYPTDASKYLYRITRKS